MRLFRILPRFSAFLALALLLGPALGALPLHLRESEGRQPIEADVETSDSSPSNLVLTIRLPGFHGAALVDDRLGPGLGLVADSARPYVDDQGKVGSELSLELSSSRGEEGRVESLLIAGEEGQIRIEAFDLAFPTRIEEGRSAWAWQWEVPAHVWRYESFPVSLRASDGSSPEAGAWPSFNVPGGLFLEGGPDAFSWTGTALEEGRIDLPPARVVAKREGKAESRALIVEALPPELSESRAVGDFGISIELPSRIEAGLPFTLRVVVAGEGNLPSLRIPLPELALGGKPLSASVPGRRIDSFVPSEGGYRGRAILETLFIPPSGGSLSISALSLAFLLPRTGEVRRASAPARRIVVGAVANRGDRAGLDAALLLLEKASSSGLKASKDPKSPIGGCLELLRKGEEPEVVSSLYAAARKNPSYRGIAREVATTLGFEAPDLGFAFLSWPLLGLGVLLLLLSAGAIFLGGKKRRPIALSLGVIALAFLLAGGLALRDQGRTRWLSWSKDLSTAPSADSERLITMAAGRSGKLVGRTEGWICLEFKGGVTGWLPVSSVYSY